jgi:hypothetical protein
LTSHLSTGENSLKYNFVMSLLLGCLLFSAVTSLLFLIDVNDARIKWPIAVAFFVIGFVIGVVYFFYFLKRQKILRAVSDLTNSF